MTFRLPHLSPQAFGYRAFGPSPDARQARWLSRVGLSQEKALLYQYDQQHEDLCQNRNAFQQEQR